VEKKREREKVKKHGWQVGGEVKNLSLRMCVIRLKGMKGKQNGKKTANGRPEGKERKNRFHEPFWKSEPAKLSTALRGKKKN